MSGRHILLVEDDEFHAELVRRAFEDEDGVGLTVVRRLDRAREAARACTPDLVIADLRLPDGDGIEMCSDTDAFPVVIMTSQGSESDAVAAMRAGAIDYVVKSESMFADMPHVAQRALREWNLARAHARADRSLRAQFEVASAMATSTTLGEASPRILAALCACVGCADGEYWRVDPEADRLVRVVAWSAAGSEDRQVAFRQRGEGVAGRTWERGAAVVAEDAYGFPVRTSSGIFGVFILHMHHDEDVDRLITAISQQLTVFAERQRADAERTRLEREVLEAERLAAIGETSAMLAHEIANPLNSMYVLVQLVQRRVARVQGIDPKIGGTLGKLLEENRRLAGLLQEFRDFGGGRKLDKAAVDLAEVCRHVLDMHGPMLRSRGIAVEPEIADVPSTVGDAAKLTQLLVNLIKNAAEAMPEGGKLSVRLRAMDEELRIEVADTGVGIPDDVDIFAAFLTTKSGGSGLGLSVARQIVTGHGGTITYESVLDRGTTFTVCLAHKPPS